MAASQFTDFIRSVHDEYQPIVSDGIFEANVLWKEIIKANGPPTAYNGMIGGKGGLWKNVGGESFQWRLTSGHIPSYEWGPGDQGTWTTPNVLEAAVETMGGYRMGYFIDRFATKSMNTPEQFIPLLKLYEQLMAREWVTLFETKLLANSTTGGWKGFPNFIKTTGTYASTIDMTAAYALPSYFNYSASGQQLANTGIDRLTQVWNGATHGDTQDGDNQPHVAFWNRTDWQTLRSSIEDQHRLINVNTDVLKWGFLQFEYSGIRNYWLDSMTGINKGYLLNMNHVGVAYAGDKLFDGATFDSIVGGIGTINAAFHKGQPYCSSTRKMGLIDNTTSS